MIGCVSAATRQISIPNIHSSIPGVAVSQGPTRAPEGKSSCWRSVPSGMKGCCGRKNMRPPRGVWITPVPSPHSPTARRGENISSGRR